MTRKERQVAYFEREASSSVAVLEAELAAAEAKAERERARFEREAALSAAALGAELAAAEA